MNNTSINVSGKLPEGLVELYQDVINVAAKFNVRILVVGAMARDLILVHGYGAEIERGTRDVDFGINVATWNEFEALKEGLITIGFRENPNIKHRLERVDRKDLPWEIDIIPFGELANANKEISWPPNADFVMSVLGFEEAHFHCINTQICESPDVVISVASPAGIVLLKLIAWLERDYEKKAKDAADINYIISSYSKIPEIRNALYDDGHMEAQDWDEGLASAHKLGIDCAKIANKNTYNFLVNKLLNQPEKLEQLIQDMPRDRHSSPENLLTVFSKSFLDAKNLG